jgi:23S rRNA-/tRNA-specific pseudouridylate synthase
MEFSVSAQEQGQKIAKYLLKHSDGSKIFLFKLFRKGLIKVNGRKIDRQYELNEGDVISAFHLTGANRQRKFQNVSRNLSVLFENAHVIAIDKDGETEVHAGESDYRNSLLEMVKSYLCRKNEPYTSVVPVHRIDRNTKGVVLFAKNEDYGKKLCAAFKNGQVDKTYQALLIGKLSKTLFAEGDIVRISDARPVQVKNLVVSENIPDKKQWMKTKYTTSTTLSATSIKPVGYGTNDRTTIADVTIWTGRHHQIRAIACAIGFPIGATKNIINRDSIAI